MKIKPKISFYLINNLEWNLTIYLKGTWCGIKKTLLVSEISSAKKDCLSSLPLLLHNTDSRQDLNKFHFWRASYLPLQYWYLYFYHNICHFNISFDFSWQVTHKLSSLTRFFCYFLLPNDMYIFFKIQNLYQIHVKKGFEKLSILFPDFCLMKEFVKIYMT